MQIIKSLLWPFCYLLFTALLAGLLTPIVFSSIDGALAVDKIFNKLTLIFLVLGLIPLSKALNISKKDLGLSLSRRKNIHNLFWGVGFGILTMLVVCLLLVSLEIRVWDSDYQWSVFSVFRGFFLALLTGLLVGAIEEPLFRGMLVHTTQKRSGAIAAIIVSALFYSSLHFMKVDIDADSTGPINWLSGISLIPQSLTQIFNYENLDSFLALFAVGVFLALIRVSVENSLALCIGIHAGWVSIIKFTKSISDGNESSTYSALVGDYDGIIGILVCLWLCVLIFALIRYKAKINFLYQKI